MADILIKGVELPKGDTLFFTTVEIFRDGTVVQGGKGIGQVVEVKPHGRLIDATELLKTVEELRDEPRLTYTQFSDGVLKNIKSAPTVLEANNGTDS